MGLSKVFSRRNLAWIYLVILMIGALVPLGNGTKELSGVYTLSIRGDYLLHAILYIPLPVFMGVSLSGKKGFWLWVAGISFVVVVVFEIVQIFLEYRGFNINDLIANGVGTILGLFVIFIFRRKILF